ncbi:MAG: ANTAR domain-containing protein [Acidimicrobiia bacterium]|nr:ANTAR domain-containing protein [Acidimicrobiia bacterium]
MGMEGGSSACQWRWSTAGLDALERASVLQAEATLALDRAAKTWARCRQSRLRSIYLRYDVRRSRRDRLGTVLDMAMPAPDEDPLSTPDSLIERIGNLERALINRDLIGQAKGILMERFKLDADEAFELLRFASQHENRKVSGVADDLVRTGEWPHT